MDKHSTLLSALFNFKKQESFSFPVLGGNNIFDKARKGLNELNRTMLSRKPKAKFNRNELITHYLNKKISKENKRNLIMIKTLHLINKDRTRLNSIEKVELIKKELNAIRIKIASPINSSLHYHQLQQQQQQLTQQKNKNKICFKKFLLNRRENINPSLVQASLTERSNHNDTNAFVNKRLRVINLLNNFGNNKQESNRNSNNNTFSLTENYSHYSSINVNYTRTISGLKKKYKKRIFIREKEVVDEIN